TRHARRREGRRAADRSSDRSPKGGIRPPRRRSRTARSSHSRKRRPGSSGYALFGRKSPTEGGEAPVLQGFDRFDALVDDRRRVLERQIGDDPQYQDVALIG